MEFNEEELGVTNPKLLNNDDKTTGDDDSQIRTSQGLCQTDTKNGYTFTLVPQMLRNLAQWGVWMPEWKNGSLQRVPYDAKSGLNLSSLNPATWSTFPVALLAYQRGTRGQWGGLSFVVTISNKLVGLDLDGCVDEQGKLTTQAQTIVALWQSYLEFSPSRRGIRGFAAGTLPVGRRKVGKLEIYDSKILTVTGWHLAGTPVSVEERSPAIAEIHSRFFGKKGATSTQGKLFVDESEPLEDEEVIALALSATNGARFQALMDGDTSGNLDDDSAADLAACNLLAFYCGRDSHEQIDRIFRERFALFRPGKWDKRHHGDGSTYGQGTIKVALEDRTEFYTRPLVWHPSRREEPAVEMSEDEPQEPQEPTNEPEEPEARTDASGEPGEPPGRPDHTTEQPGCSVEAEEEAPFNYTDLGNGERLVDRHGENLLFCNPWKKWLVWDKTRWRIDHLQQVDNWARATIRQIYEDVAALLEQTKHETDKKKKKALIKLSNTLLKHAAWSEQGPRMAAMMKFAQMDVPVMPEWLDTDLWLLNVKNGTLNLRTGELQPHSRKDLLTKYIPIAYDPDARCPLWEAFLLAVMAEEKEDCPLVDFLQSAIGYSLTGDVREDCYFLLYGLGANGKSTFLRILRALLADYSKQAAFSTFLAKDKEAIPNDIADLQGARLVVASEADEGKKLSMSVIKSLTGKDFIKARFLFAEYFDYAPQMKLWLAVNHKPIITTTDHATWRRPRVIPFTQTFEGKTDDKHLGDKLLAELPGILAWAVRGCQTWQRDGLLTPEAVKNATSEYRTEMDVVASFLDECCHVQDGMQTSAGTLLDAVRLHSNEKNFTQQKMKKALEEKGFTRQRSSITGHMMWQRIGLKATAGSASES